MSRKYELVRFCGTNSELAERFDELACEIGEKRAADKAVSDSDYAEDGDGKTYTSLIRRRGDRQLPMYRGLYIVVNDTRNGEFRFAAYKETETRHRRFFE